MYLKLYNAVSMLGWAAVLALIIKAYTEAGPRAAFIESFPLLLIVQSGALLEVVHALFRWVKSPVSSTVMQVASRLFIVWAILRPFGNKYVGTHPAYLSMVAAWCLTEIVRYGYYLTALMNSSIPVLTWCRYTLFYILYPIGAGSEAWLVYLSLPYAYQLHQHASTAFKVILAIYPPGFWMLYSYMIKQRAKYVGGASSSRKSSPKRRTKKD